MLFLFARNNDFLRTKYMYPAIPGILNICTLYTYLCTLYATYVHCTLYTALPSTRSTGRLTTHSIITAAIYTLLTLFRDKGVNTI